MTLKEKMLKREAMETPADEAKESKAYQKLERKLGVEKHPKMAKKHMKRARRRY